MPIASLKPLRKTAPSVVSSTRVMTTCWPWRDSGVKGCSTMCAVASAAESVIVTTQPVATNPSRHRMSSLPFQKERRFSSIAIEPWPLGLSAATRRYIGKAPKRVRSRVAMGESTPAASAAMLEM
jgi:hypothetical protein